MIWDSVDDWDEPRFRAKQDENNGASDVMRQYHSNTYIRRYVDNNRYSRYYYVGIYVCMYYVLSTKILVR